MRPADATNMNWLTQPNEQITVSETHSPTMPGVNFTLDGVRVQTPTRTFQMGTSGTRLFNVNANFFGYCRGAVQQHRFRQRRRNRPKGDAAANEFRFRSAQLQLHGRKRVVQLGLADILRSFTKWLILGFSLPKRVGEIARSVHSMPRRSRASMLHVLKSKPIRGRRS